MFTPVAGEGLYMNHDFLFRFTLRLAIAAGLLSVFLPVCTASEREPRLNYESVLSVLASSYESILYVKRVADTRPGAPSRTIEFGNEQALTDKTPANSLQLHSWSALQLYTRELFGKEWNTDLVDYMFIGARNFVASQDVGATTEFEGCQIISFLDKDAPFLALKSVESRVLNRKTIAATQILVVDSEQGEIHIAAAAHFLFISKKAKQTDEFVAGITSSKIARLDRFFDSTFVHRESPVWGVRRPVRISAEGRGERADADFSAFSAWLATGEHPAVEIRIATTNDNARVAFKNTLQELLDVKIDVRPTKSGLAEAQIKFGNNETGVLHGSTGSLVILELMGF